MSADAIVIGVVKDLYFIESPAVNTGDTDTDVSDNCIGRVTPAIEMILGISDTIKGEVSGEIKVRIGPEQYFRFLPQPRVVNDGICWNDGSGACVSGIQPGMEIGMPLYHFQEMNVWSPVREFLFTVKGGSLEFQNSTSECNHNKPLNLYGISIDKAKGLISICTDEFAEEAAKRKQQMLSASLDVSVASSCSVEGSQQQPECSTDSDCSQGLVCRNGRCQ